MNKPQLFFIHFAGGNSYSFNFIVKNLPAFSVTCLELPGRGKRINQPLLQNFDHAVDDILRQIREKLTSSKYYIYGHSMGALLAYKVEILLESEGYCSSGLFLTGNPGPGIGCTKQRHLMQREEMIEELKLLGGVSNELLNNKELFDFFEPILRSDFKIAELNNIDLNSKINAPIFALMGIQEEKAIHIQNWIKFTNSSFRSELLEGGHFFIYDHVQKISSIINEFNY